MIYTDEQLLDTIMAVEEYGSKTKAAEALGLTRSAVRRMMKRAAQRGLIGTVAEPVGVQEGYAIWGHSTLYDKDGNVISQWVKDRAERDLGETIEIIREAVEGVPPAFLPPRTEIARNEDLATIYPIADLHLGQYSWAEETGNDYDLEIAKKVLTESMGKLVSLSPASETAVILNLGDFFHSDSNENRTRRSGNALDVDTRYAKVLRTGVELLVSAIQLAAQKHAHVLVRNLQGNHDPYAALALSIALEAYFAGSDRVTVDASPSPYFFWRWGKVLIGATHGDMVKAQDMPGVMAAKVPKLWGETEYRYVYTGHLHTAKKKLVSEDNGAQVEVFETLAPRDAWGNSMGFTAGRSMHSITHAKDHGEIIRLTYNVKGER